MAEPGVNLRVLQAEIARQASKKITPKVERAIEKKFDQYKNEFLKDFDKHPVTKELKAGPNAKSIYVDVGNLDTESGRGGNLFSLLGFYDGESPTEDLKASLDNSIELSGKTKVVVTERSIIIQKTVTIPTFDTLKQQALEDNELEWSTRSWIDLVERGIPWFQYYLFRGGGFGETSRSGTGIQAKKKAPKGQTSKTPNQVRNKSFQGIAYLSQLLAEFKDKILRTK